MLSGMSGGELHLRTMPAWWRWCAVGLLNYSQAVAQVLAVIREAPIIST